MLHERPPKKKRTPKGARFAASRFRVASLRFSCSSRHRDDDDVHHDDHDDDGHRCGNRCHSRSELHRSKLVVARKQVAGSKQELEVGIQVPEVGSKPGLELGNKQARKPVRSNRCHDDGGDDQLRPLERTSLPMPKLPTREERSSSCSPTEKLEKGDFDARCNIKTPQHQ